MALMKVDSEQIKTFINVNGSLADKKSISFGIIDWQGRQYYDGDTQLSWGDIDEEAQGRLVTFIKESNEIKPKIICLCGSTRFSEAYQEANLRETLAGNIVLTIGCDMKSDNDLFKDKTVSELTEIKNNLDTLHFHKIDMADEILVLNVDGYIGESTENEIDYARQKRKSIRYLEEE